MAGRNKPVSVSNSFWSNTSLTSSRMNHRATLESVKTQPCRETQTKQRLCDEGSQSHNKQKKTRASKDPWSEEENNKLTWLVKKHGLKSWAEIARQMYCRTGKQCRERWFHHLDPSVNKGSWTQEEDCTLIEAQKKYGNRWAAISGFLPGRSDNAVKNRWNSTIKRRLKMNDVLEDASYSNWRMQPETGALAIDQSTRIQQQFNNSSEIQGAFAFAVPVLGSNIPNLAISVQQPVMEEASSTFQLCPDSSLLGNENQSNFLFHELGDKWWNDVYTILEEGGSPLLNFPDFSNPNVSLEAFGLPPTQLLNMSEVEDPRLQHSGITSTLVSSSKQDSSSPYWNTGTPQDPPQY